MKKTYQSPALEAVRLDMGESVLLSMSVNTEETKPGSDALTSRRDHPWDSGQWQRTDAEE